jgi:hypothetical protein
MEEMLSPISTPFQKNAVAKILDFFPKIFLSLFSVSLPHIHNQYMSCFNDGRRGILVIDNRVARFSFVQ